jgi:phage I-like protein
MTSINETIGSLVKIAGQMIDNADAPQTGTPEQVLSGLEAVIAQLEQISATIPADSQKQDVQPPVADQTTPEQPDSKVAELQNQVNTLTQKLVAQEREKLAEEFSNLYSVTQKSNAKFNEIMDSKESIDILQAKLNAIKDFAETNNVPSSRHASSSFSYVRTAKLTSGDRLHTL